MKKVWILEKFASRKEMEKSMADIKNFLENANGKEQEIGKQVMEAYEKSFKENPDGRWFGFEGKTNYNQFISVALGSIRRNPDGKFRVIEAEIPDDVTTWIGYKFVKENDGVLQFLMAQK